MVKRRIDVKNMYGHDVRILSSGASRISGDGDCEWWQGYWPPSSIEELNRNFFCCSSHKFRVDLRDIFFRLIEDKED
jgi:hypothetical protein